MQAVPYTPGSTKEVLKQNEPLEYKTMKTNKVQVITALLAVAAVAGLAGTKATGDYITGFAVTVAYIAVAAVLAMAAADYRSSSRVYSV